MDRVALRREPILKAYQEHYKRFEKTYHVHLQLESIVFKGKPIPTSVALVEAMFMAEVNSTRLFHRGARPGRRPRPAHSGCGERNRNLRPDARKCSDDEGGRHDDLR